MAGDDVIGFEPREPSWNVDDLKERTGRSDGCFQIDAGKLSDGSWSLTFHTNRNNVIVSDKPNATLKTVTLDLGVFDDEGGCLSFERGDNGWSVTSTIAGEKKTHFLRNGSSSLTPADYIRDVSLVTSDPTRFIGTGKSAIAKD